MNNEIRKIIWELSRYVQSCQLSGLSDEKISALFKQVFALRLAMLSMDAEEIEQQIVELSYVAVSAEARRRGLNVPGLPVEVVIAADGTFRKGEAELRRALSTLSFDDMMKFIDAILDNQITEKQRMTILNLARDRIYENAN
jgi:hypothetical protein